MRNLLRCCPTLIFAIALAACAAAPATGQTVGDCVRLKATSQLGVPLHASAGDPGVSGRLEDQAVAKIEEIDQPTGWFRVSATAGPPGGGWLIRRYIDQVVNCTPTPTPGPTAYVVGTWNLEHFDGHSGRGFPENGQGGPSFGAHPQADYEAIAAMIESIEAKLLLLEEIGGEEVTDANGETVSRSEPLDRLIGVLGSSNYGYTIGRSGGPQRLAILYDKRAVRVDAVCECSFPNSQIQNKNLFDRQPLIAHVTFLRNGQPMNDMTVVAVHLASGQQLTTNHDTAMNTLKTFIGAERGVSPCIPAGEMDVLIAGDFNASRFDSAAETLWADFESDGWDVLADDGASYPVTRLSGVPLKFNHSQIDYLIVSSSPGGLKGEEVTANMATVHQELVGASPDAYRAKASDHVPVTVSVKVVSDSD